MKNISKLWKHIIYYIKKKIWKNFKTVWKIIQKDFQKYHGHKKILKKQNKNFYKIFFII